jgi:hypothetical protein
MEHIHCQYCLKDQKTSLEQEQLPQKGLSHHIANNESAKKKKKKKNF